MNRDGQDCHDVDGLHYGLLAIIRAVVTRNKKVGKGAKGSEVLKVR